MDRRIVSSIVLPADRGPGIWRIVRRDVPVGAGRYHNYFAWLFRRDADQQWTLIGEWHGLAADRAGTVLSPTEGEWLVSVWHAAETLEHEAREHYCADDGSLRPFFRLALHRNYQVCEGSYGGIVTGMLGDALAAGARLNDRHAAFELDCQNGNSLAYSTALLWQVDTGAWDAVRDRGYVSAGPCRQRGRGSDFLRDPDRAVSLEEGIGPFVITRRAYDPLEWVIDSVAKLIRFVVPGAAGRIVANVMWVVAMSLTLAGCLAILFVQL